MKSIDKRGPSRRSDGNVVVDTHVGERIRLRRTLLGLSQQALAKAVGITFQQLQKYERASNRVSASRLFDLSRALDVPVSFFYDGMDEAGAPSAMPEAGEPDPMAKRETLELVRAYYRIADPTVRKRIFELTKAVSAKAGGGEA